MYVNCGFYWLFVMNGEKLCANYKYEMKRSDRIVICCRSKYGNGGLFF